MSPVRSLAVALEEDIEGMEQMGEYLVRRLVGEGGMGKVYEAEERLSKRRVALKVLHPELSKSEHARRLFLNEMQILARVEHPNIVRSLSSMEVGGELVMVLEYLDGHTLRHEIGERGRFAWPDAVGVISSAASALVAAHGQSPPVIHRDLKPENIMVLTGGAIKVMDFGIAKVIEAMNQTNTQSVGTLQYMSPEQIDAHAIDHRSDLYCLGLILYELLEGRPPFVSNSPRQLLNLQCTATPPSLSEEVRKGLPKGIEDLVFQLLEKAPEDRPYLAEDIVARLDPFISADGSALGASRTQPGPSPRARASLAGPATLESPRVLSLPRDSGEIARGSTPHERPSRGSAVAAPAASAAAPAGPTKPSEPEASAFEQRPRGEAPIRADTIALLERAERGKQVPRTVAIAIIAVLSLLSGIIAYAVRSSSGVEKKAAPTVSSQEKSAAPSAGPRRTNRR